MKMNRKAEGALVLAACLMMSNAGVLQAKDLDQAFGTAGQAAAAAGQTLQERQTVQRQTRSARPELRKVAAPSANAEPDSITGSSEGPSFAAEPQDFCPGKGGLCAAAAQVRCQQPGNGWTGTTFTWGSRSYGSLNDLFGNVVFNVDANHRAQQIVSVRCTTHRNPETNLHYCTAEKTVDSPGDIFVHAPAEYLPDDSIGGGMGPRLAGGTGPNYNYCGRTTTLYTVACGESEHRLWAEGQSTARVSWRYEHHKSAVTSWGLRAASVGFSIGPVNITPTLNGSETYTGSWVQENICQLTEVP